MKRSVREKVQMYQLVHDLLEENTSHWQNVPQLALAVEEFTTKFSMLKEASVEHHRFYSTGVKAQRDQHRKELCMLTLKVSKAIKTYALINGDQELFLKINLTESSLTKCTQIAMLLKVDQVVHYATNHVDVLGEFGITSEIMNSLLEKRDILSLGYLAPRKTILKRKDLGLVIQNMVKDLDHVLKNKIDNLCFLFESSEPGFYRAYKSARRVVNVVYHKDNTIETPEEPDDGGE